MRSVEACALSDRLRFDHAFAFQKLKHVLPFVELTLGMPTKASTSGASAETVPTSVVSSAEIIIVADVSSPPPHSSGGFVKRSLPSSINAPPSPKNPAVGATSPKRFIMKVMNVTIDEWMQRCPDPSVPGATGTGSTYAVVLCELPTQHVTTKRDMKQVPRKNILIGDDTGKAAEIVIWGAFACRAWM